MKGPDTGRLSPAAAGEAIGVTAAWVRKAIRRKWLPAVRVGRDFLLDGAAVAAVAEQVKVHGLRKWTIAADAGVTDLAEWGTADEVAKVLGTSRAGVTAAVRLGHLAAVKGSRGFLIRWSDAAAYRDGTRRRRGRPRRESGRPAQSV